jgi:uncharacterized protein (DUF58 family)
MSGSLFQEDFLLRLERLSLAVRKPMSGATAGERRSPHRGQSVEFADFRPYFPGDDFRRIDWNAYARFERFFIKLFVEEQDLTTHFMIDASRSMYFGEPSKIDYAAHCAGALAYTALCNLDQVSITALGQGGLNAASYFPPHRGKRHSAVLFKFLQTLTASPGQANTPFDPSRAIHSFVERTQRPGVLVLISDLMNDGWLEGISRLAGRGFETTVLHILAPEELDPPLEGDLKLIDSESQAAIEITADFDLLARYRENVNRWRLNIEDFCSRRTVHYIPLETTLSLDQLLFNWLRRKEVLR